MTVLVESNEQIPEWENVVDIAWSKRPYNFIVLTDMRKDEFSETELILLIGQDQASCERYLPFLEELQIPVIFNFKVVDFQKTKELINKNGRGLMDHHISVGKLQEVLKTVADGGLYFARTKEVEPFLIM